MSHLPRSTARMADSRAVRGRGFAFWSSVWPCACFVAVVKSYKDIWFCLFHRPRCFPFLSISYLLPAQANPLILVALVHVLRGPMDPSFCLYTFVRQSGPLCFISRHRMPQQVQQKPRPHSHALLTGSARGKLIDCCVWTWWGMRSLWRFAHLGTSSNSLLKPSGKVR